MKEAPKGGLLFFGTLAFLILAVCVLPFWQLNRPPVSMSDLDRIEIGMNQAQVRNLLGSPVSESFDVWTYSRKKSWSIVYVYFDSDGKVSASEYDY